MRKNQQSHPENEPEGLRDEVLRAVKKFKGNWLEVARFVSVVHSRRAFLQWGFITFDSYCTRELKLRKQTVEKLLRSYYFLEREEPDYLRSAGSADSGAGLADYESVNILRRARARKQLPPEAYSHLRASVLEEGLPPNELKQRHQDILRPGGEPPEPERERREALKRVLSSLKNTRQVLETRDLIPGLRLDSLTDLIRRIEDELSHPPR